LSQENARRYTLSGLRRARQTDPWQGPSQRSHWHRAESLSWVRGCGRVADLKIVDEKSSSDSKRLLVGGKQKVDTPLGPESPRKNQGTTLRPRDYVNTGEQSNARDCSSYVGIAKDAGVAPLKALRVYSNGPSKRAVGRPASKPTTRLIGVHCSEQRSTL